MISLVLHTKVSLLGPAPSAHTYPVIFQGFLKPMMLEVPPVQVLTAEGLANTALEVFRGSGFSDDQLEGLGWDGEYIKKRVKDKILNQLMVEGMDKAELEEWVTEVLLCLLYMSSEI